MTDDSEPRWRRSSPKTSASVFWRQCVSRRAAVSDPRRRSTGRKRKRRRLSHASEPLSQLKVTACRFSLCSFLPTQPRKSSFDPCGPNIDAEPESRELRRRLLERPTSQGRVFLSECSAAFKHTSFMTPGRVLKTKSRWLNTPDVGGNS